MKPIMVVTPPVGTRSGYSHSRDICRSLIDLDKFDVRIPVRWGNTPQNPK